MSYRDPRLDVDTSRQWPGIPIGTTGIATVRRQGHGHPVRTRVWRGEGKSWETAKRIGEGRGTDAWDYEVFDFIPEVELLAAATKDAQKSLYDARHANRVAGGDPDYAERRWRMEYPGLAALVDHAEANS